MDNASKALIMTGEILIAMMVVGIIVYSISNFGKFSSNMNQKLEQNAQIDFNNRFLKFERRIDITADEIVGIINFAKNTNDSNELYLTSNGYSPSDKDSVYFVDVLVNSTSFLKSVSKDNFESEKTKFLNNNSEMYFKCNVNSIPSIISGNYIELKPKLWKSEAEFFKIDNSVGGTQLVRQISFDYTKNIDNGKFQGIDFNMQNRDLFVIN